MDKIIKVYFKINGGEIYCLESKKNELFHSLFSKFMAKVGAFDKEYQFIYNCKYLDPMKKLGEEMHSFDGNIIYIDAEIKNNTLLGGYSLFTDLSKQITEEHYLSDEAPSSYNTVTNGINIYGICKYKKCSAYNKEVIVPLENVEYLDLINERENFLCPECEALINPRTIGFHLCEYKIKGTKFENGKGIPFEFNGKADNKDSVQYYNPDKNGETTIVELIIKITKYL